jgi:hypothetical protein
VESTVSDSYSHSHSRISPRLLASAVPFALSMIRVSGESRVLRRRAPRLWRAGAHPRQGASTPWPLGTPSVARRGGMSCGRARQGMQTRSAQGASLRHACQGVAPAHTPAANGPSSPLPFPLRCSIAQTCVPVTGCLDTLLRGNRQPLAPTDTRHPAQRSLSSRPAAYRNERFLKRER